MLPTPPAVPVPSGHRHLIVPGLVADQGDDAATRFIEFFTANIRNANTRQAYGRAVGDFFAWCGQSGIGAHSDDLDRLFRSIATTFSDGSRPL